jgi:hypothetical protein
VRISNKFVEMKVQGLNLQSRRREAS